MASNFQIALERSSGDLHVKLSGDFDGSSAFELIHALKDHGKKVRHIVIHTDALRKVHPFGTHTFQKNLYELNGKSRNIRYNGKLASRMTM